MRMYYLSVVLLMFIVLTMPISSSTSHIHTNSLEPLQFSEIFETSTSSATGILDPITIEQTGNWTIDMIHAETDDGTNTETNLLIDTANDWVGDLAVVNLWNPERLYISNGSFSDGIIGTNTNPSGSASFYPYGWDAYSNTPNPDEVCYAGYDGQAISMEIRGDKILPTTYSFTNNTWIYWTQDVINAPEETSFYLSFDYLFTDGPDLNNNISLQVHANDTMIWNTTAESLVIDTPYTTGQVLLDLSEFTGVFTFKIGLYLNATLEVPDRTIAFEVDNIKLTSVSGHTFDDLNIYFGIKGTSIEVTGGSFGFASIENASYWQTSVVPMKLSCNYPVSFDYNASIRNHRFFNSTYTIDPTKEGVAFESHSGASSDLTFNMYLGGIPDLDDFTILAHHPQDWNNVTVYNPFLTDITSFCTLESSSIKIPESILYSLGWWEFNIQCPNYLDSLLSQVSYTGLDPWIDNTIFMSSDVIRASVLVGTEASEPTISSPLNITLIMPNGTEWWSESLFGSAGQILNSTGITLGSDNTTAGMWTISAIWSNGTEVAFGDVLFEVHHGATLTPVNSIVETEVGQTISAFVLFRDSETNEILLDSSADVFGNWSGSSAVFIPNEIRNRWEVDLDTSGIEPGEYTLRVNASLQYYSDSFCNIMIIVNAADNTLEIRESNIELGLAGTFTTYVNYSDNIGNGIEGAEITVSAIDPTGGITWGNVIDLGQGNYSIDLTAIMSGTYSITIRANKMFYEYAEDNLIVLIGKYDASLSSTNGTSKTISYGQSYRFVLRYQNGTGYGLAGASVSVSSVSPSSGLIYSSIIDEGDGYYSVILTPSATGSFTIITHAEILNHEQSLCSFTLSSTAVPTLLTIESVDEVISIDQNCTVLLKFANETGIGIEGAFFTLISPPAGLTFSSFIEMGDGIYQIIITPLEIGDYQIRFKAQAANHIDATTSVGISVELIQTQLVILNQDEIIETQFGVNVEVHIRFYRTDTFANISDANITLMQEGQVLLNYSITESDDYYILFLYATLVESFEFSIRAASPLHRDANLDIQYSVNAIATDLTDLSLNTLFIGRNYSYIVVFTTSEGSTGIIDAAIEPSGRGSDWCVVTSIGEGQYNITISPLDYGSFTVSLDFEKDGYLTSTLELTFTVASIPIEMQVSVSPWYEKQGLTVNVTLSASDNDEPVTGAIIQCILRSNGIDEYEWILDEVSPGFYSKSIIPNWQRLDVVSLLIHVDKEDYSSLSQSFQIFQRPYERTTLEVFVDFIMIPLFASLGAVFGLALSVRSYGRRKTRIRRDLMEIKMRFDDVSNILGMLILHKRSGLPIFSKVLKGGFEEGMLSAFITAITHFRSEFDTNGSDDEHEWKITPISDIIRAVPTHNLICAFVTLTSPSLLQEANMLLFSRAIGLKFDNDMESAPTQVADKETTGWIDETFNDYLDGFLLHQYRISPTAKSSRKIQRINEARATAGLGNQFTPFELSRGFIANGIDEGVAYKLILDSINTKLLIEDDN